MLISVIITAFNHEKYISDTIFSVSNQYQKNFDIEIIIGEDCSKDNTFKKIKEALKKSNFKKVVLKSHPQNVGVAKNIFNCMSQANGDFVCFLDGDDFWIDRSKIEEQIQMMREKQVDFIFDKTSYVNKFGQKLDIVNANIPKTFDEIFMGIGDIHTSSTMLSKRALKKILKNSKKFLDSDIAILDILFWLTAAESYDFFYNEKITTAYRIDESSMSNSEDPEKLLFMNRNVLATLLFFFNNNKKVIYLPTILRRLFLFIKFSLKVKKNKKLFIDLKQIYNLLKTPKE